MIDQSMLSYFTQAGAVVKVVMAILLLASLMSWTFIFQRWFYLRRMRGIAKRFVSKFWSGGDLNALYAEMDRRRLRITGLEHIFYVAFSEFVRLRKQEDIKPQMILDGVQRAMRIAQAQSEIY